MSKALKHWIWLILAGSFVALALALARNATAAPDWVASLLATAGLLCAIQSGRLWD